MSAFLPMPSVSRLAARGVLWLALCAAPVHAAAPPVVLPLGSWSAGLTAPARVAAGSAARSFVSDPSAGRVLVFDAFGRCVSTKDGLAAPLGIAVAADGTVFVGETGRRCVSVFDAQWQLLHRLGGGDGEFALPGHIVVETVPGTNVAYVCDGPANEIKVFHGTTLVARFGSAGSWEGEFNFPAGICVSAAGEVFVVDQNNDRVQVFTRAGGFLRAFALGSGGMGLGGVSGRAQGIAVDMQGRLYVADSFQGTLKVFDSAGAKLGTIGGFGAGPGQFRSPCGVALDPLGRLLVASMNNQRVEIFGIDDFLHVTARPPRTVIAAGGDAAFSVATGGGDSTFQWRRNGAAISDGGNFSGATTAGLRLVSATTNDSGEFSVAVTGAVGTRISPSAALTVMTPPAIAAPPTNWTVTTGAAVMLQVGAAGDSVGFQWRRNGADIPGATGSSLQLANLGLDDTANFSVAITNAAGTAISGDVVLTVRDAPGPPLIGAVTRLPGQRVRVEITADTSATYTLETSSNLADWTPLTNFVFQGGVVELADPDPAGLPQRFYRVMWSR
jgi:DNA-binding beta-propeller fold protein YncE